MIDLVYKTVNGLEISLSVELPPDASKENKAPVLLWFHGGGLLQGTRRTIWPHLRDAPHKHGLCLVSADYRLAPQVRMPDIMSDIADCVEYIRGDEFREATGGKADARRMTISGGSAGGWLALLASTGVGFEACGLKAPAPPLVCAAIYPITDLLDPFWTTKQPKPSYFPRRIEADEMKEHLDPSAPVLASNAPESSRTNCYHYMVQEGILAELLLDGTGISPAALSIAPALKSGAATAPPTYITHGTVDDKVPFVQAADVAKQLESKGIEHVFDVREGLDHIFDKSEDETMDLMYDFIKRVLARHQD